MAEAFLSLHARERADILRTVAARSGRAAIILEKDIWVCWVLQALFSMPDPHPMAFKGGTSLSKVYRIIDRFSEDVDVTLDYRAFKDGFDPFADGASRNQIRLFSERLKDRVATYIRDVVAPALGAAADALAPDGQHDIHIGDDGETIRFAYPSAVEDPHAYVRSEVLLEFGGRNVIDPNEQHTVSPDISAGPRLPTAHCWRMSSGTRTCFSTPGTPTTINASTAGCGSSPTTTSFPACKPTTTPCAPPPSSLTTHPSSTRWSKKSASSKPTRTAPTELRTATGSLRSRARFRPRTLPCCVAGPPSAGITTPRERVPRGGGERIVGRKRIRSPRTRPTVKSMYRFVLWPTPNSAPNARHAAGMNSSPAPGTRYGTSGTDPATTKARNVASA